MNKNIKKITAITTVASASVLFLTMGARAVFTDNPDDYAMTFGKDGTVDISVSELDFDVDAEGKAVNINPGDCDPYSPAIANNTYRSGTVHELAYHVENLGTKSVRTRQIITISMVDINSNVVDPTPMMISELEGEFLKEINNTYNSLSHKYYCLENGDRIEVTEEEAFFVDEAGNRLERIGACGLEPSRENIEKLNLRSRVVKIQYVIISNVLDGTSADMNHDDPMFEDPAEIEHETQITGKDYQLFLGMYHQAETNAYSKTSIVANDGNVYLLDGLRFDQNNNVIGTKVTKILNGYYNEASELAPDGKMYAADDVFVEGTTITGSEVEYIDMKYRNATLLAQDGNMYLVKDFSFGKEIQVHNNATELHVDGKVYVVEDTNGSLNNDAFYNGKRYSYVNGNVTESYIIDADGSLKFIVDTVIDGLPAGATVQNGGKEIVIDGKTFKVENTNSAYTNNKGYYYGKTYTYTDGEDTETYLFYKNSSLKTTIDEMPKGTATSIENLITLNKDILFGTKVIKQGNKYLIEATKEEVSIDEVKHWDIYGNEVWNSTPKYYKFTNPEKTEYVEINERDVVHWIKDDNGTPTYETIFNGADKYVITDTGEAIEENEIAHWDTNYNMIAPTDTIGELSGKINDQGTQITINGEVFVVSDTNGTLNNDGYYYGKKYTFTNGNHTESYIFYEDGSVDYYYEGTLESKKPAGTVSLREGLLKIGYHETIGYEGASVKVSIEVQAQQYRNTTNDDWSDWTTYGVVEKEYSITPEYASDFEVNQ